MGFWSSSLVFVAIAFETWLAFARINTKSNVLFIPDKGAIFVPNSYYRNSGEGFSEGYFNSHGFRDYDRSYQKDPNTFRIMVLGDSYVQAIQVALSDSFPALLEQRLNENSTSMKFEVLALGMNGFGTAEEYMRYLDFGVDYSPDMVILAFLTGNDFSDNSRFLSPGSHAFYFAFDENKNLVLDRSVIDDYQRSRTLPRRLFQKLKQNSYLANLVSERVYLLKEDLRLKQYQKRFYESRREVAPKLDEFSVPNIYLPEPSEHWQEAFDITKGIILKFRDSVEEHGSRFVLVSLSNAPQVHPELQKELNSTYGLPFDFGKPDRIIEEFASQNGISYLKLMPTLLEYHLKTGKYLHGFGPSRSGHWNENGHCVAAETIFQYLQENGLVSLGSARDHSSTHPCESR